MKFVWGIIIAVIVLIGAVIFKFSGAFVESVKESFSQKGGGAEFPVNELKREFLGKVFVLRDKVLHRPSIDLMKAAIGKKSHLLYGAPQELAKIMSGNEWRLRLVREDYLIIEPEIRNNALVDMVVDGWTETYYLGVMPASKKKFTITSSGKKKPFLTKIDKKNESIIRQIGVICDVDYGSKDAPGIVRYFDKDYRSRECMYECHIRGMTEFLRGKSGGDGDAVRVEIETPQKCDPREWRRGVILLSEFFLKATSQPIGITQFIISYDGEKMKIET